MPDNMHSATDDTWFDKDVAGFDLTWCPIGERGFMNELVMVEAAMPEAGKDGQSWMYRPYPLSVLGKVLTEVDKQVQLTGFLEVGCGPGTKLLMVDRLFPDVDVLGFDYNEQYIAQADELLKSYGRREAIGLHVGRAEHFTGYASFNCVYVNRPLWDWQAANLLERTIAASMAPGSVLILANAASQPNGKILAEATTLAAYEIPTR
jgi:SAM-dependent methyltransferase